MKTQTKNRLSQPAAATPGLNLIEPVVSDRLRRLLDRFHVNYAAVAGPGHRHFTDVDEAAARNQAYLTAYRATTGEPTINRRARALEEFAESALIRLEPDDLLAGSQKFCVFGFPEAVGKELTALGYAGNAGHIVHDYAALLRDGIAGLLTRLCARQETVDLDSEFQRLNLADDRNRAGGIVPTR